MNVQNQPHVKMAERRSLASTTRPTRDDPVSERRADAPAPYRGFDGQYINGSWRPGRHGGVRVDTDPYSGATLAEMVMANQSDLDEAYHAAAKAAVSSIKAKSAWVYQRGRESFWGSSRIKGRRPSSRFE